MKVTEILTESVSLEQLTEEFDLIESIIERLAAHNGVDAEVIWEDLETLTEDELYAFAVTSEPIMESQGVAEGWKDKAAAAALVGTALASNAVYQDGVKVSVDDANKLRQTTLSQYEKDKKDLKKHKADLDKTNAYIKKESVAEDWQKANKRDKTDGMSQKAVNAYRRENPGSKLKTAVTTKPSKLKKGGKASKRRKSYCSRSRGQMKMHSISCAKTPDKAICKARRRWNC